LERRPGDRFENHSTATKYRFIEIAAVQVVLADNGQVILDRSV
jgi:hypothetical protein